MSKPLVSCIMVTRDRAKLAARAVRCLAAQTWKELELVIIDDGDEDYTPILGSLPFPVTYKRIPPVAGRKLGELRNLGLESARGEMIAQWDDDEWYHPRRIETQVNELLASRAEACVLKWTLMHVDTPDLVDMPYRADAGSGTPGTIVHRRTRVRYPNLSRSEDAKFLDTIARDGKVAVLGTDASHLFIRCFHGNNTWDAAHFQARLRRTPYGALHWVLCKLRGDLRQHPQLRLTAVEQQTVRSFLAESRELGLVRS